MARHPHFFDSGQIIWDKMADINDLMRMQEARSLGMNPLVVTGLMHKVAFLPHMAEKMLGIYTVYQAEKKTANRSQ